MNPIVGIGELLWDVFPTGRKVAGGAPFNFAFHCHNLGHPAVMVSRVGDDDLGRELREEVRRLGMSDEFIQTDREHATGTVQVKLDERGVPTYTITENVAWDHLAWDGKLADLAGRYRATCFGTLAMRTAQENRPNAIRRFVEEPSMTPLRVADINLRPPHVNEHAVEVCFRASWLKMSADELRALAGDRATITPRAFYNARLSGRSNVVLIVTDGEAGVTAIQGSDEFTLPAAPAQVVDTVGAGDAFTAAMVCLHLEGRSLRDAARFAVHYAARVCEHAGAVPQIDRGEVERAVFSG